MPRTTARVNKGAQVKATAAAKRARVEEAGLRGPRVGKISATTRSRQARRDAKSDAAAATAAPAKAAGGKSAGRAVSAAPKAAAKSPPAGVAARRGRGVPVVEVRTANSVAGGARLDAFAERVVTDALSRFLPRVTRIDVHLSDANADKEGGDDKHCQIEVRVASRQPVSATAAAGTIEKALTTAANKMKRLLATQLGRARTRGGRRDA